MPVPCLSHEVAAAFAAGVAMGTANPAIVGADANVTGYAGTRCLAGFASIGLSPGFWWNCESDVGCGGPYLDVGLAARWHDAEVGAFCRVERAFYPEGNRPGLRAAWHAPMGERWSVGPVLSLTRLFASGRLPNSLEVQGDVSFRYAVGRPAAGP